MHDWAKLESRSETDKMSQPAESFYSYSSQISVDPIEKLHLFLIKDSSLFAWSLAFDEYISLSSPVY